LCLQLPSDWSALPFPFFIFDPYYSFQGVHINKTVYAAKERVNCLSIPLPDLSQQHSWANIPNIEQQKIKDLNCIEARREATTSLMSFIIIS